jgi:hypothetical protein
VSTAAQGAIAARAEVESSIEFAPGCSLAYSLEASVDAPDVAAELDGHRIRVTLPEDVMRSWTESDDVSIDARQAQVRNSESRETFSTCTSRLRRTPARTPIL